MQLQSESEQLAQELSARGDVENLRAAMMAQELAAQGDIENARAINDMIKQGLGQRFQFEGDIAGRRVGLAGARYGAMNQLFEGLFGAAAGHKTATSRDFLDYMKGFSELMGAGGQAAAAYGSGGGA
jgi:hypothetical protein